MSRLSIRPRKSLGNLAASLNDSDITPEEYGITVLHQGKPSAADIICIHGLNSTPNKCWRQGNILWPRDLLPKETNLINTRIATFGYNSGALGGTTRAGVTIYATKLLEGLLAMRNSQEEKSGAIIFICHSFGGIVLKQALVTAHEYKKFQEIYIATTGIVFLGTPHRDSESASFCQTMANIAKVAYGNPGTRLIATLGEDSQELQDLCEEFSDLHGKFQIVTCFETEETMLSNGLFLKSEMVSITSESSVKLGIVGEILIGMKTDHRNICKFGSARSAGYMSVKDRVVELVEMAPDILDSVLETIVDSISLNQVFLDPCLPAQTKELFGREAELEKLHTYFDSGSKTAVLWGSRGMGKSQLALKYQESHQPAYGCVLWVHSQNLEDIHFCFQNIAQNLITQVCQLFPTGSEQGIARMLGIVNVDVLKGTSLITGEDALVVIEAVKAFLNRDNSKDLLLVFDNWEPTDTIDLRNFFPEKSHCHILITSDRKDDKIPGLSLELSGINTEAGARLLLGRRLPEISQQHVHDARGNQDFQDAEKLAAWLEGNPLALDQAEAYMFLTQTQVDDYLAQLSKYSLERIESTMFEWEYEKNETIILALEITLSVLTTLNPDACNLLSSLAFLGPLHITEAIFRETGSRKTLHILKGEAKRVIKAIQSLVTDQSRFIPARDALFSAGLLKRIPQGVDIHPLIHQWSRLRLEPKLQQEFSVAMAFTLATKITEINNRGDWITSRWLSPHVNFSLEQLTYCQTLTNADSPSKLWSDALLFINEQFALFYCKTNRLPDAVRLYKQLLGELNHYNTDEGKLRQSNISEILGRVMWEMGHRDQAEKYVKSALDSKAELLDDSVVETAELLNDIKSGRRGTHVFWPKLSSSLREHSEVL